MFLCSLLFVLHLRHNFIVITVLRQTETEEDEQELELLSVYLLYAASIHVAATLRPSHKEVADPCPHKGNVR